MEGTYSPKAAHFMQDTEAEGYIMAEISQV